MHAYSLHEYACSQPCCYLLISLVNIFLLLLCDLFLCVITVILVNCITAFPLGDSLYGAY